MLKMTLIAAAAAALLATSAHAETSVYTFQGTCGDCQGVGTATLTLEDYTPGADLTDANLVDFSYSSNLTSFDINPETEFFLDEDEISGSLGTAPGYYNVNVGQFFLGFFPITTFSSASDGTWSVYQDTFDLDHGTAGTWNASAPSVSAAPEPGAWALMFAGVAMIGGMLRLGRKRGVGSLSVA